MTDLMQKLGVDLPIIQAPMAGSDSVELCVAVSNAGGLGSLACALLSPDDVRQAVERIRAKTDKPFNLNFFCHDVEVDAPDREIVWRKLLRPYFDQANLASDATAPFALRLPFDDAACVAVEDARPSVVSFHFGLPAPDLLDRVKATGALVLASATTVSEAKWLEKQGIDAIIAQGSEAGGHRGTFLTKDVATQVGLFALLPQLVDSVDVPVIAAGGIGDARGVAASLILGAHMAQIGTAYLFCPEGKLNPRHAAALAHARDDNTALTNLFSGRPARGIVNRLMLDLGPMNVAAPAFPFAGKALAPLRARAEADGRDDFTNLWSGQAAALGPRLAAGDLTRQLAEGARAILSRAPGLCAAK
jgi:nitronate monooxygenase